MQLVPFFQRKSSTIIYVYKQTMSSGRLLILFSSHMNQGLSQKQQAKVAVAVDVLSVRFLKKHLNKYIKFLTEQKIESQQSH